MQSPSWSTISLNNRSLNSRQQIREIKFVRPKEGAWFVPRERLQNLFDASVSFPLVTVVAPVGYGKTSALADWVTRSSLKSGWWTLSDRDNSLPQFLLSFVELLQTVDPGIGSHTLSLIASMSELVSAQEIAESLASELLDLKASTVLVLDGFQFLTDERISEFLSELSRLSVPNLHIVISSQMRIPVQRATLRAKGILYEIDQSNLEFTVQEARAFLARVFPDPVSEQVARELVELSGGWVAAIHLAALTSIQSGIQLADVSKNSFSKASILEFLRTEVFDRQSEETQAWLLRLSIPDQINQDLAEILTEGHSPSELGTNPLEILLASGLLAVVHLEDGKWYRINSMLREALLALFYSEISEREIAKLHRKAFDWFEAQGDIDSALSLALSAKDVNAAAALIARHAQATLIEDNWLKLDRWISALPWDIRILNYELLVSSAWIQQVRGRHDLMHDLTSIARDLVDTEPIDASLSKLRIAELDLLDAINHTNTRHPKEQQELLIDCLETLMGSGRFAELPALLWVPSFLARTEHGGFEASVNRLLSFDVLNASELARHRAIWARSGLILRELSRGNYQGAADKAVVSITESLQLGMNRKLALSEIILAVVRTEENKLDEAEELSRSAYTNPSAGILVFTLAGCMLGKVLNAKGLHKEADDVLSQLLENLLQSDRTDFLPEVRTSIAHICLIRGQREEAIRYLRLVKIDENAPQAFSVEPRAYVYAIAHLVEESDPEREHALATLNAMVQDPRITHWTSLDLRVKLGLALAEYQEGDVQSAFDSLGEILSTAERHGIFRTLVDVPPVVLDFYRAYQQAEVGTPYLLSILAAAYVPGEQVQSSDKGSSFSGLVATANDALIEPLSEREQDVLLGLQNRLTNKEIAAELNISPLTVKSHTRSIYGKLEVNSRRQAVLRGIQTGLLRG